MDRRFHLVDDVDRVTFLDAIGRASDRWDWQWLSYALMSSHVHYGNIAGADDPDRFFRSAHTRFALGYHRRRGTETLGPVFADRPTLHVIRPRDLARLVAYHHRNPVEAGVVDRPSNSSWTSHRAYLRLDPAPAWLDVERALSAIGFQDSSSGRRHFDEFVTEVDLDQWRAGQGPGEMQVRIPRDGTKAIDWPALTLAAREIARLPEHEPLTSKSRVGGLTRRLISIVATRDLGQTYASVGVQLDMRPSSVFNLVARPTGTQDLGVLIAELRRRLIAA